MHVEVRPELRAQPGLRTQEDRGQRTQEGHQGGPYFRSPAGRMDAGRIWMACLCLWEEREGPSAECHTQKAEQACLSQCPLSICHGYMCCKLAPSRQCWPRRSTHPDTPWNNLACSHPAHSHATPRDKWGPAGTHTYPPPSPFLLSWTDTCVHTHSCSASHQLTPRAPVSHAVAHTLCGHGAESPCQPRSIQEKPQTPSLSLSASHSLTHVHTPHAQPLLPTLTAVPASPVQSRV